MEILSQSSFRGTFVTVIQELDDEDTFDDMVLEMIAKSYVRERMHVVFISSAWDTLLVLSVGADDYELWNIKQILEIEDLFSWVFPPQIEPFATISIWDYYQSTVVSNCSWFTRDTLEPYAKSGYSQEDYKFFEGDLYLKRRTSTCRKIKR